MPFDFDDAVTAPFRMQPGLRRLAPGTAQLTPNLPGSAHLAAKLAALRHHPEHALLAQPGFDPDPAIAALAHEAAGAHPDSFDWRPAERHLRAAALGWSVTHTHVEGDGPEDIGALLHALPAAWRLPALLSLALRQDLALIDGRSARIPWLAVCLPSRWAPEEKIGRHFAEVHAPVADNRVLLAAADHLARLVTGPARWERFVWTLSADPGLMQHPAHAAPLTWPEGDIFAHASFRTEHQTFIPLPRLGLAWFTIEIQVSPLAQAVAAPGRAERLRAALASMSPAVLRYRGLTEARERLLAGLGGGAS